MEEENLIERLRKGERIICAVCRKHYYDVSYEKREISNYFHCEDPDCKGYVHIQKSINVE